MPATYDIASEAQHESHRIDPFAKSMAAIALLVRLLIVVVVWHAKPASWFYSQASELGEVAHSVSSGDGLASPFGGNTGPSAFLPPGYPLLVGGIFRAFGDYSRGAELALLLAQACFGAVAVLFLMLLGRLLFGPRTANIAGTLLAFDPWLIALSFVFWETSFSLMALVLLVYIAVRWIQLPSKKIAYIAALLSALSIAVNASMAITVIALFAWAAHRRKESRRLALLPGVLFLVLCDLWPLRNAVVMHAFIPLRDNLGYELWQGNRFGADGFFAPELHPNINKSEFRQFQSLGELGYMREKSKIARRDIAASPKRFVSLTGKRVACFWLGISRRTYPNQIFIATVTSLLGLAGLGFYIRKRGLRIAVPIILPLLLFPVPYYITHPDFRFWCLLSPLLTMFAVYTGTQWVEADAE